MAVEGIVILVDIYNIIKKLFMESYIRKNFKILYDEVFDCSFTYTEVNKKLIYSITYDKKNHKNIHNEIIIDLTDYEIFIENLYHIFFKNKCVEHPIVMEYDDVESYLIYYYDNKKYKLDKKSIINYFRETNNYEILNNFMNEYFKNEIKDNKKLLKLFNNLFDDIEDFVDFFDAIVFDNSESINEKQIWS